MKPKNTFEGILKSAQHEFNDDYEEIIMDGNTPTGFYDFVYEGINAPRYRDFLNDMTLGEGDSWFDMQNNTFEFSPTSAEVSILNLDEKKSSEMASTKTTERSPASNDIGFCHIIAQDKCDGLKKIYDISKPKADSEKVKAKAVRVKINKNNKSNHKYESGSNDLPKGKESHVVKPEMKSQRIVENNAGAKARNPVTNFVSKTVVNNESRRIIEENAFPWIDMESSQKILEKNMDTRLNKTSKAPVVNIASQKRIDKAPMIRNAEEVNQNVKDSVGGVTSKVVISPDVKHVTVPRGFDLSKRLDPPKQNRDYPTSRSPGIKKRQPIKRSRPDLTVPKPFIFRAIPHVHMNEGRPTRSPFISLAERVKHFLEDTPERFKSKLVSFKPTTTVHTRLLTVPKSPYLRTKQRANACKLTSAEGQKFDDKSRSVPGDPRNNCCAVPTARKVNVTMPRSPLVTKPQPPVKHHKVKPHHFSKEPHKLVGFSSEAEEREAKIRQDSQERAKACKVKAQPIDSLLHACSVNSTIGTEAEQKLVGKEKLEKENIRFHAKAKVTSKKSDKPLTEPVGFVFQTDSRIQLRKARDQNEGSLKKKKSKEEEEIRNQRKTYHLPTELVNNSQMVENFASSRAQPSNTKVTKSKLISTKTFSRRQVVRQ